MPKWKKDAKEFTVGVNYHKTRGYQSSIPKPVMDALNNPTKVTFIIRGKKVELRRGERELLRTQGNIEQG